MRNSLFCHHFENASEHYFTVHLALSSTIQYIFNNMVKTLPGEYIILTFAVIISLYYVIWVNELF